ncbi:MAG TPA: KGK domain-containing protein [Leptolyngbyaceae cyanobacterium]
MAEEISSSEERYVVLLANEVLSSNNRSSIVRDGSFGLPKTFQVEDLLAYIESRMRKEILEGVECEAMRLDRPGWQKGKVRVRKIELEFCPDQPADAAKDSTLDQIRLTLNEANGQI